MESWCPPRRRARPAVPQLSSGAYLPIWELCAELGVPICSHGGSGSPGFAFDDPADRAVGLLEVTFYSHRPLWQLIFSGAFQRFPDLRLVMTEQGSGWIPGTLSTLDEWFGNFKHEGMVQNRIAGQAFEDMTKPPSEYFATNCYVAASSVRPIELTVRDGIGGAGRIMWGADYPHVEGSHPHTLEALRYAFEGISAEEVDTMLAQVPAEVYGFDLDELQKVADKIGPTMGEILEPLEKIPADSTCSTFDQGATIKAW